MKFDSKFAKRREVVIASGGASRGADSSAKGAFFDSPPSTVWKRTRAFDCADRFCAVDSQPDSCTQLAVILETVHSLTFH